MNSFIRAGEKVRKTEERLHDIIPLETAITFRFLGICQYNKQTQKVVSK